MPEEDIFLPLHPEMRCNNRVTDEICIDEWYLRENVFSPSLYHLHYVANKTVLNPGLYHLHLNFNGRLGLVLLRNYQIL